MSGIIPLRAVAPPLRSLRYCFGLVSRYRAYASAAAAQLRREFYEEDDERYKRRFEATTMEDSEVWVPERGVQWLVMGDSGAKKQLYAKRLSELLNVPHISMRNLVSQEINHLSSIYKQIAKAVNEGKLVPEEIIFGLLSKRLEECYCKGETGFILDGIPRTRIQAEILDQIVDIDLVVNLKSQVVKRNLGTGNYHPRKSSSNSEMERSTGSLGDPLTEEFHTYTEQNKQLDDYYRKQSKLVDFQVTSTPGETWPGLLAALHLQHINAVTSSQNLTARFGSF